VALGGSGQAFDNRAPSVALNYLVALQGFFPASGQSGSDGTTTYLGQVVISASDIVPPGWARADGQFLQINNNSALFSLIGFQYGGNGTSTFALPDLRDRAVIGASATLTPGTIVGANSVVLGNAQALGTITNDDALPVAGSVSIADVVITEGDAGTKLATFTLTRTGGTAAFDVSFSTANGTATAGSDYVAAAGTASFAAGVNTATVSVIINGDTTFESNETFFVNLASPTNGATLTDAQALGTITNDDAISNGNAGGILNGTSGNDFVDAQGGNDIINTGAGNDTILAGAGRDTVNAGSGNDTITGGAGRDVVNAGSGNDTIIATINDGNDIYNGDTGNDTIDYSAITVALNISLGNQAQSAQTGTDQLNSIENAIGGSGNDNITGNGAANVVVVTTP
jgi:microcystin-dependent protein